jgi:hypothetical protein
VTFTTTITKDAARQLSTLTVVRDGVEVAAYTYQQGQVLSPARVEQTLSRAEFTRTVTLLMDWFVALRVKSPSYQAPSYTFTYTETAPLAVAMTATLGLTELALGWTRASTSDPIVVTLGARPAIDLSAEAFQIVLDLYNRFLKSFP